MRYKTPDGQTLYTQQEAERWFGMSYALMGLLIGATFAALIGAIASNNPPPSATEARLVPPVEFTGGVEVRVRFTTPEEIATICDNSRAAACWDHIDARIIAPNPCYEGWEDSFWANERATLCHELAHVNGWMHGQWQDPEVVAKVEGLRR